MIRLRPRDDYYLFCDYEKMLRNAERDTTPTDKHDGNCQTVPAPE